MTFNTQYVLQTPRGILRELGQRVRERRIAAGLTQSELATRVGITPPTVRHLEAGAMRSWPRSASRGASGIPRVRATAREACAR